MPIKCRRAFEGGFLMRRISSAPSPDAETYFYTLSVMQTGFITREGRNNWPRPPGLQRSNKKEAIFLPCESLCTIRYRWQKRVHTESPKAKMLRNIINYASERPKKKVHDPASAFLNLFSAGFLWLGDIPFARKLQLFLHFPSPPHRQPNHGFDDFSD